MQSTRDGAFCFQGTDRWPRRRPLPRGVGCLREHKRKSSARRIILRWERDLMYAGEPERKVKGRQDASTRSVANTCEAESVSEAKGLTEFNRLGEKRAKRKMGVTAECRREKSMALIVSLQLTRTWLAPLEPVLCIFLGAEERSQEALRGFAWRS